MHDFSAYKFRPSSLGKLMTNPRSKSETLSETTKTYLEQLLREVVFNRKKEIRNKMMDKGNLVEEDSLTLMSQHYKKLLLKNKQTFSNDYIEGTPDVVEERVKDAKSSWDLFTFPMFSSEVENKDYEWQMQGYMWLTGREFADLCYCLVNTPEHLIVAEKRRRMYDLGLIDADGTPEYHAMEEEIERNMTFDDIPAELRIKVFTIARDDAKIEELKERIAHCRAYMQQLYANFLIQEK
jgi:hypothetical protein